MIGNIEIELKSRNSIELGAILPLLTRTTIAVYVSANIKMMLFIDFFDHIVFAEIERWNAFKLRLNIELILEINH